jgi:hypothetical protein
MPDPSLYDRDFYAWTHEQAALLRAGQVSAADIEHIAEEIESMGRSEQQQLENRLVLLMFHLLKWRFQPGRRGSSWQATIRVQRITLARLIKKNPSLKAVLAETSVDAYEIARIQAASETELPEATFPLECPWTFEQIMNAAFWPGDPTH